MCRGCVSINNWRIVLKVLFVDHNNDRVITDAFVCAVIVIVLAFAEKCNENHCVECGSSSRLRVCHRFEWLPPITCTYVAMKYMNVAELLPHNTTQFNIYSVIIVIIHGPPSSEWNGMVELWYFAHFPFSLVFSILESKPEPKPKQMPMNERCTMGRTTIEMYLCVKSPYRYTASNPKCCCLRACVCWWYGKRLAKHRVWITRGKLLTHLVDV